jgi:recombination protein RecA
MDNKLISKVVKAFSSKFGENSASTLTHMFSPEKVHGFIPTGNLTIDWVIGRKGFPIGRITEIAGYPGSGKSSICAAAIGAAQKQGAVCMLFDTEHSYESNWSQLWGVDPEQLILIQPEHLQGLFDKLKFAVNLIKEEQPTTPIFIVIDSVSASPTAAEVEEEDSTGGKQRAAHAVIISEGLRKISDVIWNQNASLLFVSQLKDNPGVMYGAGRHKLGGRAIEFHAGLMLRVVRTGFLKDKDTVYGQTIQVESTKNKFVPPFRCRTFDLIYNEGIRPVEIMIDFLSDIDLKTDTSKYVGSIKKAGGWYEFEGSKYRKEDLAVKITDPAILEALYHELNLDNSSNVFQVPTKPVTRELPVLGPLEEQAFEPKVTYSSKFISISELQK